jgi:hypothetical protein
VQEIKTQHACSKVFLKKLEPLLYSFVHVPRLGLWMVVGASYDWWVLCCCPALHLVRLIPPMLFTKPDLKSYLNGCDGDGYYSLKLGYLLWEGTHYQINSSIFGGL